VTASESILIVDDDEQNLYLLRAILEGHGHGVVSARDGKQALELARSERPCLVISDILMPVMDGFALCRAWKSDDDLRAIPFIFYTATYTHPRDERFALDLGADRFLVKPAEPELFMEAVTGVLDEYREGHLRPSREIGEQAEPVQLRQYNAVLIHKLEDKLEQLETANRNLENEVADRRRAQEEERRSKIVWRALADTCRRYLETGSLRDMAEVIVDRSVAITGAEFGIVIELQGEGPEGGAGILAASRMVWTSMAGSALDRDARRAIREKGFYAMSANSNLLFAAAKSGETICVNHAAEHPSWSGALPDGHPPVDSFLCVPLILAGEAVGLIALANRPDGFGDSERREIGALADTAALALRMARSEEDRARTEAQLRQSERLRAIGSLAGGVAHDFNNILMIILGNAEMALMGLEEESPLRESLNEIRAAGLRASDLTLQLLAFGRKQVLNRLDADLNQIIANLLRMVERVIGENIELETSLATGLGTVHVDPGQVEQLLLNLVLNARDAQLEGGRISIETYAQTLDDEYVRNHSWAKGGDYSVIVVSDEGHGMDRETLTRIFEPFFTTKEVGEGTGLGLSTVHGVVTQHGGMVHAYSEPGLGTTFRVYFPVVPRPPEEPEPTGRALAVGGSETILLAEDEPAVRHLTARILEEAGYEVIACENGEAAVQRIQEAPGSVDLLVFDVVMPKLGGAGAVEKIREIDQRVSVLLMSGYGLNTKLDDALRRTGAILLRKPFSSRELLIGVRRALGPRNEGAESDR
jgi:signal transduction histidine kinase/DNA-binding response OmpR family regulator